MLKYAQLVEAHTEAIAQLESACSGAPVKLERRAIEDHVAFFRYYAGLTDKISGALHLDDGDGAITMTVYEALDMCAAIGSWHATPIFAGSKVR